jgi:MFS family permease
MLGMVASSTISGLSVSRTGRYKRLILVGLLTMVVGFVLVSTLDVGTAMVLTVAFSVLVGLGIGPTNSLFVLAVQNAFPIGKLGTVTSANMFFRQMGGTIGVAVFGAMVAATLSGHVRDQLPPALAALPPTVLEEIASPNLLTSPEQLAAARALVEGVAEPGTFDALVDGLRHALASALGKVFLVGAASAALALVAATFLPELELRGPKTRG